jgi:hypothetical protein
VIGFPIALDVVAIVTIKTKVQFATMWRNAVKLRALCITTVPHKQNKALACDLAPAASKKESWNKRDEPDVLGAPLKAYSQVLIAAREARALTSLRVCFRSKGVKSQ